MDKAKIRTVRLIKQEANLQKQPIQNALVAREDFLNFYFCLYGLKDDFENGFYFGLLELHPDYPFAPPKLFMYTPNGRYDVGISICTSFTTYHPESWTSAWNVRTLIQATISFMYSDQPSYGCRNDCSALKKKYAKESFSWNMKNQQFKKMFQSTILKKLPDFEKMKFVDQDIKSIHFDLDSKIYKKPKIQSLEKKTTTRQNKSTKILKVFAIIGASAAVLKLIWMMKKFKGI